MDMLHRLYNYLTGRKDTFLKSGPAFIPADENQKISAPGAEEPWVPRGDSSDAESAAASAPEKGAADEETAVLPAKDGSSPCVLQTPPDVGEASEAAARDVFVLMQDFSAAGENVESTVPEPEKIAPPAQPQENFEPATSEQEETSSPVLPETNEPLQPVAPDVSASDDVFKNPQTLPPEPNAPEREEFSVFSEAECAPCAPESSETPTDGEAAESAQEGENEQPKPEAIETPEDPADTASAAPAAETAPAAPVLSVPESRGPSVSLPPFRQKRICVSLVKGGVGKTTITCFVATAIQKIWDDAGSKCRLLVVDADPQGSATDFFLNGEDVPPEKSLRALFPPYPFPDGDALLHTTRYSRIDILPAHTSMARVNPTVVDKAEEYLAWYLEATAGKYSLILIDTPPSDTLALRNALTASSGILIPVDPSRQALKTLTNLNSTLREYALEVCGVALSRYAGTIKIHGEIYKELSEVLAPLDVPLYIVPRRAGIEACYNSLKGYEGLDGKKEPDAAKVFHDMAIQVISTPIVKEPLSYGKDEKK